MSVETTGVLGKQLRFFDGINMTMYAINAMNSHLNQTCNILFALICGLYASHCNTMIALELIKPENVGYTFYALSETFRPVISIDVPNGWFTKLHFMFM